MIEVASRKDILGAEYKVWFVAGDLWFIIREEDGDHRFFPYDRETPSHINEAILDYCWREVWDADEDEEPDRQELIQCALDNNILADSDHRIESIENWPTPTQAAIDHAWSVFD